MNLVVTDRDGRVILVRRRNALHGGRGDPEKLRRLARTWAGRGCQAYLLPDRYEIGQQLVERDGIVSVGAGDDDRGAVPAEVARMVAALIDLPERTDARPKRLDRVRFPVRLPEELREGLTVLTCVAPGCPWADFLAVMARLDVPQGSRWIVGAHVSVAEEAQSLCRGPGTELVVHDVPVDYRTPQARALATAELYAQMLALVDTERLLVLEHDVLPRAVFLANWLKIMADWERVVAIGAPVPDRASRRPMVWLLRDRGRAIEIPSGDGIDGADAVSLSCTLLRTDALRGLELRPQAGPGATVGTDLALMGDLAGRGHVLCDWAVDCEHRAEPRALTTSTVGPEPPGVVWEPERVREALSLPEAKGRVHVVVTTHDAYVQYLSDCLDSVVAQTRPADEITVAYNGSAAGWEQTEEIAAGYAAPIETLRIRSRSAQRKRNDAARRSRAEYLLFVDGDDRLAPTFLGAGLEEMRDPRVAISYPDIHYFGDKELVRPGTLERFDRHRLCCGNYITSTSLVRRIAFEQAGGWDASITTLMDWNLWLRMTGAGWLAAKARTTLFYRRHGDNMSLVDRDRESNTIRAGNAGRTLAIVTPFAGRQWALERWLKWIAEQSFDHERVSIVALDNSCDPSFGHYLRTWLARADYQSFAYHAVPVGLEARAAEAGVEWQAGDTADSGREARTRIQLAVAHATAANLAILQRITWADDILIVEDDVEPPLDAVEQLRGELWPREIAGVSGVVRSRWSRQPIAYDIESLSPLKLVRVDVGATVRPIGAVGFGCLLIRAAALRQIVPRPAPEYDGRNLGTDYAICRDLAALGWRLKLHGGVVCRHYSPDGSCV